MVPGPWPPSGIVWNMEFISTTYLSAGRITVLSKPTTESEALRPIGFSSEPQNYSESDYPSLVWLTLPGYFTSPPYPGSCVAEALLSWILLCTLSMFFSAPFTSFVDFWNSSSLWNALYFILFLFWLPPSQDHKEAASRLRFYPQLPSLFEL